MENKRRNTSKTVGIIIALVILIGGAVLFYGSVIAGANDDNTIINTPIKVQVQKAEHINQDKAFSYSGTIEESESVPLSFSVTGTVSRVMVSEGDKVKKGQLLAIVDDETVKNIYEASLATLKQAEDAYKRLTPMYKNGSLPEIKFVEVETALKQAKATMAISQKKLDDCKLVSPIDGFIGRRSLEPGQNIVPGLTAIKIIKIDKLSAKVAVSESEISFIRIGQNAKITVGALGYQSFEGVVEEIGVVADPLAHTYKIKIGLSNTDNSIKPGMICEALIHTSKSFDGLIIPNQAIQVDENGATFVYCIDTNENRAKRKNIEIGQLMNGGIEVTKGLNSEEMVVIAGQQKLVDGSKITIVD